MGLSAGDPCLMSRSAANLRITQPPAPAAPDDPSRDAKQAVTKAKGSGARTPSSRQRELTQPAPSERRSEPPVSGPESTSPGSSRPARTRPRQCGTTPAPAGRPNRVSRRGTAPAQSCRPRAHAVPSGDDDQDQLRRRFNPERSARPAPWRRPWPGAGAHTIDAARTVRRCRQCGREALACGKGPRRRVGQFAAARKRHTTARPGSPAT